MPSFSTVPKGIGLILMATFGIVLMNTCAKMGGLSHGPIEMVFYRGMVALGLLVPYMIAAHPLSVFTTSRLGAHLYRSIVGNLGVAPVSLYLHGDYLGHPCRVVFMGGSSFVFGRGGGGDGHRKQCRYGLAGTFGDGHPGRLIGRRIRSLRTVLTHWRHEVFPQGARAGGSMVSPGGIFGWPLNGLGHETCAIGRSLLMSSILACSIWLIRPMLRRKTSCMRSSVNRW